MCIVSVRLLSVGEQTPTWLTYYGGLSPGSCSSTSRSLRIFVQHLMQVVQLPRKYRGKKLLH